MITKAVPRQSERVSSAGGRETRPRITLFHCINAIGSWTSASNDCELTSVKMPCSSMTREVFLLRAFEAGADGVIVMVCPEGSCRYVEGNIRAGKRVARVKKLLDEIGLDGRRLNVYRVSKEDQASIDSIISRAASELIALGPNPAA